MINSEIARPLPRERLTAQAAPLCLQGLNGYKALTSLLLQYRTIS
jgi:hypothetical protein